MPEYDNNKLSYLLHLSDNSLIMGHRLSEWTGHGPLLEQDIAISNIALDMIGQARYLYQYAAEIHNTGNYSSDDTPVTEDSLAYLRHDREFKNILLVELPNGDWAKTILKLFFFSVYQQLLYKELVKSSDVQLAAIAEKSLKEVTYHVRWSSDWVIRMGDGTQESNQRLRKALEDLWSYTGEMFIPAEYEETAKTVGYGADLPGLSQSWHNKIAETFQEATLEIPPDGWMHKGGKTGLHTEHLGYILAEMQSVQRAYPGCEW